MAMNIGVLLIFYVIICSLFVMKTHSRMFALAMVVLFIGGDFIMMAMVASRSKTSHSVLGVRSYLAAFAQKIKRGYISNLSKLFQVGVQILVLMHKYLLNGIRRWLIRPLQYCSISKLVKDDLVIHLGFLRRKVDC